MILKEIVTSYLPEPRTSIPDVDLHCPGYDLYKYDLTFSPTNPNLESFHHERNSPFPCWPLVEYFADQNGSADLLAWLCLK